MLEIPDDKNKNEDDENLSTSDDALNEYDVIDSEFSIPESGRTSYSSSSIEVISKIGTEKVSFYK